MRTTITDAWCKFVVALIIDGGLAGPECISEIFALTFHDISNSAHRYIHVPRQLGRVPVYVPASVSVLAASLCIFLKRNMGRGGRNRIGTYPENGYTLPDRPEPCVCPSEEEIRAWTATLEKWLAGLCTSCNQSISLSQLIQLARARVFRFYPPPIAAYLTGIHLLNPIPVGQIDTVVSFRNPLDIVQYKRQHETHNFIGVQSDQAENIPNRSISYSSQSQGNLSSLLIKLRQIVVPYSRAEKSRAQDIRPQVLNDSKNFIDDLETKSGKTGSETWNSYLERQNRSGWTWYHIQIINAIFLARWIFEMVLKTRPPHTVEARLNHLLRISRFAPTQLLFELDAGIIRDFLGELSLAPKSVELYMGSLYSFHKFVSNIFPVSKFNGWAFRRSSPIFEQGIITQTVIEQAISYMLADAKDGLTFTVAMLLMYFFGLRVSELINLRLGDVWLDGTPTVFVWFSKNNKSRFVEAVAIPDQILKLLRDYFDKRMECEGTNRSAYFLARIDGSRISSYRMNKMFGDTFRACGVKIKIGEKCSSTHILRHSFVNRLLALGIPLIEISRKLGHASVDTTIRNYAHIFPYMQREFLRAHTAEENKKISARMLAQLAGLSERRIRQLSRQNTVFDFSSMNHIARWLSTLE
jgi:integrase